jgi:pimeloyl-ACP methyl ester carboxylesterase
MTADADGSDPDRITVEANGLSFECLRAGEGDRLALCLHGFPDDAGSMTPLLDRLAAEGFTAVAPYMRGYGPTDPAPDGDYSVAALGEDAVALVDALGEELGLATDDAVLVGHDWGALAGYAAAGGDPDAFDRMVTMAVPPGVESLFAEYPRQVLRSWYMWFFQFPTVPERALRWREFTFVDFLWGLWSPDWDYPPSRIEAVKETFRSGDTVEHAVQYYRDTVDLSIPDMLTGGGPGADEPASIETPTLVIFGQNDGCIGTELFAHADEFIEDCRVVGVSGAGHFVHQERPDVVADEIIEWL